MNRSHHKKPNLVNWAKLLKAMTYSNKAVKHILTFVQAPRQKKKGLRHAHNNKLKYPNVQEKMVKLLHYKVWQYKRSRCTRSPEQPKPCSGAKNVKPASSSRSPLNAITCSRTHTRPQKRQSPPRPCPPGAFPSLAQAAASLRSVACEPVTAAATKGGGLDPASPVFSK